jgi:hypothetical protein
VRPCGDALLMLGSEVDGFERAAHQLRSTWSIYTSSKETSRTKFKLCSVSLFEYLPPSIDGYSEGNVGGCGGLAE